MLKSSGIKFGDSLAVCFGPIHRQEKIENEKTGIDFLSAQPIDILKLIFSLLEQRDLNVLALVSKCIYYFLLENTPENWKHIELGSKISSISRILSISRYSELKEKFLDLNIPKIWNHFTFNGEKIESILRILRMKRYSNLITLYIHDIEIDRDSLIQLFGLKFNQTLEKLVFHHTEIKTDGMVAISEALKLNTSLRHLGFNHCCIATKGPPALMELLNLNTSLKHLSIDNCSVKKKWLLEIIKALKSNATLDHLNLSNVLIPVGEFANHITTEILIMIMNVLESNITLKSLAITRCNIESKGERAIAKMLKANTTLERLDLSYGYKLNGKLIAKALKVNTTLKYLDLSHTMEIEGIILLAKVLKNTKNINRTVQLSFVN